MTRIRTCLYPFEFVFLVVFIYTSDPMWANPMYCPRQFEFGVQLVEGIQEDYCQIDNNDPTGIQEIPREFRRSNGNSGDPTGIQEIPREFRRYHAQ